MFTLLLLENTLLSGLQCMLRIGFVDTSLLHPLLLLHGFIDDVEKPQSLFPIVRW